MREIILPFVCSILTASPSFGADLPVPDNVVFDKAIEFTNTDNQHLQVNRAMPKNGQGPFPAVPCIHGGGFLAGTRVGYDNLCLTLAEHGYVAITFTYRLVPKYQFPASVLDCKTVVRWLRANAAKQRAS